jgi:tRNA pseudouridine38-40 synthase
LQNICLTIEYDGTDYAGWQSQKNQPSIEDSLRAALASMRVDYQNLKVAGRTDAGVHALAQIVNFNTTYTGEARRLAPGLNAFLPPAIRIQSAKRVEPHFNARLDSVGKYYCYTIVHSFHPSALYHRYAWWLRNVLPREALQQRALMLMGEHDFNAFRSSHCDAAHAQRTLHQCTITQEHIGTYTLTRFHLLANAFCRHMCRIIVGTLVQQTQKNAPPQALKAILLSKDRRCAGITAPAKGLCLVAVDFSLETYNQRIQSLHPLCDKTSTGF